MNKNLIDVNETLHLTSNGLSELLKRCWISVKDKLPEKYCIVLFTDSENVFAGEFLDGNWLISEPNNESPSFPIKEIKYWMPLPTSPTEDTNNE